MHKGYLSLPGMEVKEHIKIRKPVNFLLCIQGGHTGKFAPCFGIDFLFQSFVFFLELLPEVPTKILLELYIKKQEKKLNIRHF